MNIVKPFLGALALVFHLSLQLLLFVPGLANLVTLMFQNAQAALVLVGKLLQDSPSLESSLNALEHLKTLQMADIIRHGSL